MFHAYRDGRPLAAGVALSLLASVLLPVAAAAQTFPEPRVLDRQGPNLTLPTMAASAAAAADWATTYHGLSNYQLREVNPFLRPLERKPGRMITVGAAIDSAAFSVWNVTVGQKHPKVAAAGLWGMAAFRTYLAIHNMRNMKKAERRQTMTRVQSSATPHRPRR
jgi:hypothetical protein